jgi:RNA polymerase sigma-70 factor (ECF subfamily)
VTRPPGGAALALEPAQASTIEHELRRTLEADRPLLRSVLRHYRIPLEDAEDLIQDTLVLALMKWPQIRSLGPWLYGTLRHRCIGYWRKRRAAAAVEAHLTAEFAAHLCPAPPAGQRHRERRLLLAELARGLPWRYRRLLVLRLQLGMTPAEVAAATGYSVCSVRKMIQRAISVLRQAADAGHQCRRRQHR